MSRSTRRITLRDSFYKESRKIIAIIADEQTTVGFLLAGIGECHGHCNYMVVKESTPPHDILAFFTRLCANKYIGVILIDRDLLHVVSPAMITKQALPIVLDITTKRGVSRDKHHTPGMQR